MNRLAKRVRRNPDYAALKSLAEEYGLIMRVEPGGRLGHPRAVFERDGRSAWVPMGCSPCGRTDKRNVRSRALRRLRQLGVVDG